MSKRPSVVYQTTEILKTAYMAGFGRSRHADKKNALNNNLKQDMYTKNKIYSQNTYNSTKKTCVAFVKHCREEYGIKYLAEIKPNMFKSFIKKGNFKTGKAYDPKTAATYATQVAKLQNTYNIQHNSKVVFVDADYKQVVGQIEQKRNQLPRKIHDEIIQKAYNGKYENGLALDIARALGLRVTEITNLRKEDFKFNKNGQLEKVHIHRSKGGRNRNIEASKLTQKQIQVVNKVYNYFAPKTGPHDRFFINKAQSYEKAFKRARDSISSGSTHCGIHSMRKEFAKDFYNRELEKGKEEKQIKKELTELLGHNRLEILNSYLK